MKISRCPYHVKQGFVDVSGKLVLSDICGIRSACGASCPLAPFQECSHKTCQRFSSHVGGGDRQVLVPKSDLEYLSDVNGGSGNFSEIELL